MTNLARLTDFSNELIPSWFSDDLDILFRNFFDNNSFFKPVASADTRYPVDIHETEKDLNIEIAVAGINKNDISIEEEDGILRVTYDKQEEDENEDKHYFCKSIAKRSFNFGWKIAKDKFDLKKIDAQMDKGILVITIPKIEEKENASLKNTVKIK